MTTNHGVGGSIPSSPTAEPEGNDLSKENHNWDSGPKATGLRCGSFVKVEWALTFFF